MIKPSLATRAGIERLINANSKRRIVIEQGPQLPGGGSVTTYKSVTKGKPCPVCEGDHKCSLGADGSILCGRRTGEQPGFRCCGPAKRDPTWTVYLPADHLNHPNGNGHAHHPPTDWPGKAQEFETALTPELRLELAQILNIPEAALMSLHVGYSHQDQAWTFSEKDVAGQVIGINRRYQSGEKRVMPGGHRGLTLPDGWSQGDGPLFLVEGASDTALLLAAGQAVVGRPSCTGGIDFLAALLAQWPTNRPIVVIGENDFRVTEQGQELWPGRAGALRTATELSSRLHRQVRWSLPPGQAKDVRARARDLKLSHDSLADEWGDFGMVLAEELLQASHPIDEARQSPKDETAANFPSPIPCSQLQADDVNSKKLWGDYLHAECITLLSSLPKAGKTTLISHLLRSFEGGEAFCGMEVTPARVLIVSEEHQGRWAKRRDTLGLTDALDFVCRPFNGKPSVELWQKFVAHIASLASKASYHLVVLDTISSLWPVTDENDAAQMQAALLPLHTITLTGAGVLAVHHLRKSGGDEGTGARGSGALTGFVDAILELRRFDSANRKCAKRVLTGFGRWEVPPELVVEWDASAGIYRAIGDRQRIRMDEVTTTLQSILPRERPGFDFKAIKEAWPEEEFPRKNMILSALEAGEKLGLWVKDGSGRKGQPFTFWVQAP
jgi:hypothetical protein